MADHAHRGEAALNAGDFSAAIDHYTLALSSQPEAVNFYIKRSTAYQRSSKFDLALADAEKAVSLATKRAKRELIAQSQLRRGIALFQLGQYANAKFCLEKAKKLNDKEKSVDMWMYQCESKLKGLGEDEHKVTVVDVPDVVIEKSAKIEAKNEPEQPANIATAAAPATPAQTPKEKIRHDWYQNNESVTINLLAKGVPKEQASVDFQETSVSVSFPLQTGSTYDFSLEPLFASINTAESKFRILSTKIEITLKKQNPGQKWANLEGEEVAATDVKTENGEKTKPQASGPAYPTSSRSGPKNWDKIAQSYQKPPPKSNKDDKEDEEKDKDDMYVDDYEDGDPANAFFKKLYAGADPDTRRAMMKSYQESGGTALSTDWGEVQKKKVEVSPPDGMEEKKWEY